MSYCMIIVLALVLEAEGEYKTISCRTLLSIDHCYIVAVGRQLGGL